MTTNEKLQVSYKMVEVARVSRGMNQAELAEKLGIEQGTLSKIETGIHPIKDELIVKLCSVLQYPKSFFAEDIVILSPMITHYRKRKSLTNFKLDFIEYNIYIKKHLIKKLLKSANISTNLFHVSPEDYEADMIAYLVRQKWNVPRGPIKNMVALLEKNGVVVLQIEQNDEKLDGEMIPDENNLPVIYINKSLTGDRQRYTLAHELGHLIMHGGETIPNIENAEKEADLFAGAFLMPEDEVRYQLDENLSFPKLADLKMFWKVSMAAIIRRAKSVGAIEESRYTSLNVQLSRAGYKKKEPILGVLAEKPVLVKQLLDIHFNKLKYSLEELAIFLCITTEELRSMIDFYNDSDLKVIRMNN